MKSVCLSLLLVLAVTAVRGFCDESADSPGINYPKNAAIRIPYLEKAPTIDGSFLEDEWNTAAMIHTFRTLNQNGFVCGMSEATTLRIGYVKTGIFMGWKMNDPALIPYNCMESEFMARFRGGIHHGRDDSIQFAFSIPSVEGKYNYQNTRYAAVNYNNYASFKGDPSYREGDRNWRPHFKIARSKSEKGFWIVEVFVPFKELGLGVPREGEFWFANFLRNHPRLSERGLWTACSQRTACIPEGSERLLEEDFGKIFFAKRGVSVLTSFAGSETELARKEFSCSLWSRKAQSIKWIFNLGQGNKSVFSVAGDEKLSRGKSSFPVNFGEYGGECDWYALSIFTYDGQGTYYSGRTPLEGTRNSSLALKMKSDKPVVLYWNGKAIDGGGLEIENMDLALLNAANVLALKPPAGVKVEIKFKSNGEESFFSGSWMCKRFSGDKWREISFDDSGWQRVDTVEGVLSKSDGNTVYRKTILNRTTVLYPRVTDNTWHLGRGETGMLVWSGVGVPAWNKDVELNDFELVFEIPEGLELVGVCDKLPRDSYSAIHTYRENSWGTLERGKSFNLSGKKFTTWIYRFRCPVKISDEISESMYRPVLESPQCHYIALKSSDGAPEGENLAIRVRCRAYGGCWQEVPQTLNCQILPPYTGEIPKRLNFFLLFPWEMFTSVNSREMQTAAIASAKHAGVNWLFGTFGSDVATSLGVRQTDFFNFWADAKKRGYHGTGALNLSAYIKKHSESVCIGFDGAPGKTPCPVWMAEDTDGIWDVIADELDELKKRTPNTSALFWDYEFHPYANGKDACYTAFSELGMRRFSEKFNIREALTPQLIKDKYHAEWYRFLAETHRENARLLHALCTERNLLLLTWTDYISKEKTGFDLALTAPYTDIVMCGYGRHAELLKEISSAAGNKLNTGILYKEMFCAAPSVAKITRRVLDGRNGFHTWFPGGFDGLFLHNLSVASRSLVRHEDLIMDGKELDVRKLSGYDPENIYAFDSGEKAVIFVINESSGPEISCELPVNKILQRRVHEVKEFYTGALFGDGDRVSLKVPAKGIRCLEMEFAKK